MPTKVERDEHTGLETTGHSWDGIRELNRPLPKWWVYVFYACIAWSLVYYVLYPAIPGLHGHTQGVLGWSRRAELRQDMVKARAAQSRYLKEIAAAPLEDIQTKPELLTFALAGGRAAFADNCAPCHGSGATGSPGYPSLADDDWLWGGTLDDIHRTITYGIRSDSDETRQSQMPAFGRDGILKRAQIADVAQYVLSLSGKAEDPAAAKRGQTVFADNCAACHGADGTGNKTLGAPNLADQVWLYKGTAAAIRAQVTDPKHGVMPAWTGRLDETTIKMLTVYVHSLGGGR